MQCFFFNFVGHPWQQYIILNSHQHNKPDNSTYLFIFLLARSRWLYGGRTFKYDLMNMCLCLCACVLLFACSFTVHQTNNNNKIELKRVLDIVFINILQPPTTTAKNISAAGAATAAERQQRHCRGSNCEKKCIPHIIIHMTDVAMQWNFIANIWFNIDW